MGILASASGCKKDASTPVIEKGKGPSSFKATQPRSAITSSGKLFSVQTIESSSTVRVTQWNFLVCSHSGMAAFAARRQTASGSPRTRNFKLRGNSGRLLHRPRRDAVRTESLADHFQNNGCRSVGDRPIACSRPWARSGISCHRRTKPSCFPSRLLLRRKLLR